jgi:hypothetical protein
MNRLFRGVVPKTIDVTIDVTDHCRQNMGFLARRSERGRFRDFTAPNTANSCKIRDNNDTYDKYLHLRKGHILKNLQRFTD